ncbi:type IV toxin-antitoxin system AbiEi family antitoxin domain-containing protein [Nocardioides sp. SYSU D00038]|uniref:type IV toxin-antitoxin system AbiEi family antitoxin domain-containing protein n=1 Tax=Nocardioides sp. SYSU D00038 TaxID=2812554 RepID=UPI0019687CA5|nr:type IV toxin-antitoxin system AbiEi family antitoxin domain-containing protein [Nocardioides sp. SYSU D00038]
MTPGVVEVMAAQHGLVLRRQARERGMTTEDMGALLARGEWVALRRGVYMRGDDWAALDEYVGRPIARARAASLSAVMPHLWSHDSAGLAHGFSLLAEPRGLVHFTRLGVLGGRTRHGVKHHKAPFTPRQLVELDGQWMLDPARTAVDIAREHGLRHGLAACDSARRLGTSVLELSAAVAAMEYWPHVTRARAAVGLADPGAANAGESLTRLLLVELGLGPIETQFGLRADGRTVFCDLRVGRHVVEFDGRIKYQPESEGGVAGLDPGEVLWREKLRQDFIASFELGISRVVWADLAPSRWEATKARLRSDHARTKDRYGDSIDDLAPYRVSRSPAA